MPEIQGQQIADPGKKAPEQRLIEIEFGPHCLGGGGIHQVVAVTSGGDAVGGVTRQ